MDKKLIRKALWSMFGQGRPIYTFAFDKAAGQVKGQGAQRVWYVISPTGREIKVLKLASKSTPTPPKSSACGRSNY